jgi:IS605 OrfB family transposase
MIIKKTINCKIIGLTYHKKQILDQEYNNFQDYLQLRDILWWNKNIGKNIFFANKQQADRFYKIIKNSKKYPISLRNDRFKIEQQSTKISNYWLRIPIKKYSRTGGRGKKLWVAIRPQKDIDFSKFKLCESKLYKINEDYFVNIVIQKEITLKTLYSSILAIDLGEKIMATTVLSRNQRPQFYGQEIRGIRRKYAFIRKNLGKKKLLREIKRFGNKEERIINHILHTISKQIVEQAEQNNSIIVMEDLKNLKKSAKDKGKRMRRIVHNFPYDKLTHYITYKANWLGIKVIKVNPKNTSKLCSECGQIGTRVNQGLFKCKCGYQVNADFNASKNIMLRSLEYISNDGVELV